MNNPLRILLVGNFPRERELGGARVQMEAGEALRRMGHEVDYFTGEDAFARPAGKLLEPFFQTQADFARKAAGFIARNAGRYDVIDTLEGSVARPKQELGFSGLLVVRSVGLTGLYEKYAVRWRPAASAPKGHPMGNLLRAIRARRTRPVLQRSLKVCDLFNMVNEEEVAFLRNDLGLRQEALQFPYGLFAERRAQLRAAAHSAAAERKEACTVAFVGTWDPRKGSRDFSAIIAGVTAEIPGARFLLLGTGKSREEIIPDLVPGLESKIEVVPYFKSDELPQLLRRATVGVFPSYVESFGFAVLEMLAAGLPVVAYRSPGPTVMLRHFVPDSLVDPGDAVAMAEVLARWLRLEAAAYDTLGAQAEKVAGLFDWEQIARETAEAYRLRLP